VKFAMVLGSKSKPHENQVRFTAPERLCALLP
jgi:hypothetical protein